MYICTYICMYIYIIWKNFVIASVTLIQHIQHLLELIYIYIYLHIYIILYI